ncbi:MAG: PilZ domain-containing protein [Bdellovibrionales bacterium]
MFIIFDSSSGQFSEQPTLLTLIDVYSQRDMSSLHFWTLGLEDWLPLSQVLTPQLLQKKRYQMPALPPMELIPEKPKMTVIKNTETPVTPVAPAPPAPLIEDEMDEVTQKISPPIPTSGPEARKSPRFDIRIKVILSNKEKTFLSYTQNVSTSGVLLEDVIPTDFFQNDTTEIFISSPKKNEFLAFRCTPVGDMSSPKRFTFGQISADALKKFQDWIDQLRKDS